MTIVQSLPGAAPGLGRRPEPHLHLLFLRPHREDDVGPAQDQHHVIRRRQGAGWVDSRNLGSTL